MQWSTDSTSGAAGARGAGGLCGLLLCLAILFLPATARPAQDDEYKAPTCRKCQSTGRQPCSEHKREACALEDEVLYCSVIGGCEVCAGVGYVDCVHCDNELAEAELLRRRDQVKRYAESTKWLDKEMERPLAKVETQHFIIVWEMRGMKVDKKRLGEHEMLHLTAKRMEKLFDLYCATLGAKEREFKEKFLLMVWYYATDQHEASLRFCQTGSPRGVKLLGATPRYSVCANKQSFRGDEDLHRNLIHNVTHLIASHQDPAGWVGDKKYGWIDAGLAHWFEEEAFGICTNYCYQEQNTMVDFKSGKYRLAVRKMVALDKQVSMAMVMSRTTGQLTPAEHSLAFSYVDYLIKHDGEAFNHMMKMCRKKIPARDALERTFDMSVLEFETKWQAWVLETYPTR